MAIYEVNTLYKDGRVYSNTEKESVIILDLDRKRGMNPGSSLLAALGTCKLASFIELKDKYGMKFEDVSVKVKGETSDIMQKGLRQPQSAFRKIEVIYDIVTSMKEDEIREYLKYVDLACTIGNSLNNSIEIKTFIRIQKEV